MILPLDNRFDGAYYDGRRPVRQPASIVLSADGLQILREGEPPFLWTYSEFRVLPKLDPADPVRLERTAAKGGEALVCSDDRLSQALAQYSSGHRQPSSEDTRFHGWPAVLLAFVGIAVLAFASYYWGVDLAARSLAAITPVALEERLGKAVVNILVPQKDRCSDPQRQRLLDSIVRKLTAAQGRSPYQFRVIYARSPIVNAFAAPGGYIVVFQGLLRQTRTPEELAGVIAHEMQHVAHRHSTLALARHMSASLLLSLLVVDSSGTPTAIRGAAALMDLHHQRSDEEQADRDSIAALGKARIAPNGLAGFLRHITLTEPGAGSIPTYLSSHPAPEDRIRRIEAAAGKITATEPLMTPEEWATARDVCSGFQ